MKPAKPFLNDLLGRRGHLAEVEAVSAETWLSRVGSISLILGAASVINGSATELWTRDDIRPGPVPPRFQNRVEKRIRALGTSALLARQSNYRLPGNKGNADPLGLLAGSDNCPGTPIPAGAYTAANPYIDSGSIAGANNTVWNYGGGYYYSYSGGPDHVYSFTLAARGPNPRIEISTSSSTSDPLVYIANGMSGHRCPTGTENTVYAIAGSITFNPGGPEVMDSNAVSYLPLNVPLHLFVDSWSNSSAGPYTVKLQDVTIVENPMPPANDAPLDMDGDGRSDLVIARNNVGQITWHTRTSNDTFLPSVIWGTAGDVFVPANYDADGKVDYAVWRPGAPGRFYIIKSQTQTIQIDDFGQAGDDPTIVADFTGDGLADPAVYRTGATSGAPSYWYYRNPLAPDGFDTIQFGQNGDKPVPGDFDGDGRADMVLHRAEGANGKFLQRYWWGDVSTYYLGFAGDMVVPGDFDDDGITDFAVARVGGDGSIVWDFDPSNIFTNYFSRSVWGIGSTDILAPGDYDGDGQTDFAVWRPGNPGTFHIKKPGTGQMRTVTWGETGDIPVANSQVR